MRLIDADKLINALCRNYTTGKKTLGQVIDEQPTAFDVDKVVEQLETRKARAAALQKENTSEYFEGETDAFEFAIKIVKGGGVE